MRVAIYTRVASFDAGLESHARQEKDCRDYADDRGWTVVDVYSDTGMSRGERNRLLLDAQLREFDAVLAWDPSRLARLAGDMEPFLDSGLRVVTANGALDTQRPADAFIARLKLAWPEDAPRPRRRVSRSDDDLVLFPPF